MGQQQKRSSAGATAEAYTAKVSKPCRCLKSNKVSLGDDLYLLVHVVNIHGVIAFYSTGFGPGA